MKIVAYAKPCPGVIILSNRFANSSDFFQLKKSINEMSHRNWKDKDFMYVYPSPSPGPGWIYVSLQQKLQ